MPRQTLSWALIFAVAAVFRTGGAASQSAAAQTGVIRGRVLAGDTGLPLRGARVTANAAPRTGVLGSVTTDAEGRYEIPDLPAGSYIVTAEKGGYVTWSGGQRRPNVNPPPVTIAAGDARDRIDVLLPRAGTVVVHVTNDLGGAMGGLAVELHLPRFSDGQRRLVRVASSQT